MCDIFWSPPPPPTPRDHEAYRSMRQAIKQYHSLSGIINMFQVHMHDMIWYSYVLALINFFVFVEVRQSMDERRANRTSGNGYIHTGRNQFTCTGWTDGRMEYDRAILTVQVVESTESNTTCHISFPHVMLI